MPSLIAFRQNCSSLGHWAKALYMRETRNYQPSTQTVTTQSQHCYNSTQDGN